MLTSMGKTSVINQAATEYTTIANSEYIVKFKPCLLSPKRKRGIFKIKRNMDNVKYSGVICESSIDVPEIPLSYNFTGAKNSVTPMAFMHPATSKKMKFFTCRVCSIFFMN